MASDPATQSDSAEIQNSPTSLGTQKQNFWKALRQRPYFTAVLVYVVARLATLLFLLISDPFLHRSLSTELRLWDGTWFLRAVENGWPTHLPMINGHVAANPIAFFPLLPLLIKGAGVSGIPVVVLGVLISGIMGLIAVIGVGALTRTFASREQAERAALLFALFPGGFVFSLIYSEGLVITFVAFGLIALLQKKWWRAGILGLLASASSPVGLAFIISCCWCAGRSIQKDRNWSSLAAPILAPLGFVAWMGFLWAHTGNVWAWRLTEKGGWKSYPSLMYPINIVTKFALNPTAPTMTGQILFLGTIVAGGGIYLAWRERQPMAIFLYGVAAVGAAALSAPVGLRPRFLLLAFPLIIAVGTHFSGWKYRSILILEIMLLILMTALSFNSFAVFP